MSQQAHWKASSLATTFSSHAGFNSTAWGAARPSARINGDISCGLGFGQSSMMGNPTNTGLLSSSSGTQLTAPHYGYESADRRQKRKASSEDEGMESSSPTPEPAVRKFRTASESRRSMLDNEGSVVAGVIGGSSFGRRQHGVSSSYTAGSGRMPANGHVEGRKRTRVMDAAVPNEVSLDKLLEPLEEKGLRSLLDALILQNPDLACQVRQLVPKPTVNSACRQLARLERRLQAAFPYNKTGVVSDDYTYSRVKSALEELRDTIIMYLDHFTHYGLVSSTRTEDGRAGYLGQPSNALSHPAEWFDLLTQATDVAVRMPRWDKAENNGIRRETLRLLADGWLRATMATSRWTEEGHLVGRDMLLQWAQQLEHFDSSCGEALLFQPAIQVFHHSFGQYYGRGAGSRVPLESTA
ncbi:Tethering factor for nuclear proteasome sts1 [Coemansia sp. RSA 1939]|nr:Tethering factor for nuclear proteasome sts1 [Coemansia sp. RSA 1939]